MHHLPQALIRNTQQKEYLLDKIFEDTTQQVIEPTREWSAPALICLSIRRVNISN